MDWMTMSLAARNLASNNVAHVGPDFARQKTESWAAASQALRERRPEHLDLAYAPGARTKCPPPLNSERPARSADVHDIP